MNIDLSVIPSVSTILEKLNHLLNKIDHKYLKRCIENSISEIKENPDGYKLDKLSRNEIIELLSRFFLRFY